MNEALVYFLLGTVVSVPAGIAATLLTPGVQRWLDNRATKISRQRLLQLKQQFHQVKTLHDDRSLFYSYLLGVVIRLTLIGSFFALVTGLLATLGTLAQATIFLGSYLVQFAFAAAQISGMIGAIVIVQVALRALRVATRVDRFEQFREDMAAVAPEAIM